MTELTLEQVEPSGAVREDWSRLAAASGNVFLTPEWSEVWERHLPPRGRKLLLAARDADGTMRALWPLYALGAGPLRLLRQLGHGPADELGPVCAPEDRVAAARALRAGLRRHVRDGVLLAERLPSDVDWGALLGGRPLVTEASPVLPTGGLDFAGYLQTRSKSFRGQVGRRQRKLEREHGLEIDLAATPEEVDAAMTTLLELHEGRFAGESDAFAPPLDALHREFALKALTRGWLRLYTLRLAGEPKAAWYGFRFGDADAFYQSGRDPEAEELGVGNALLSHTIGRAFDDGLAEYRFLRGDEPYKKRWSEDDRTVITFAVPVGRTGTAIAKGAATAAGSDRLRSLARRLGA